MFESKTESCLLVRQFQRPFCSDPNEVWRLFQWASMSNKACWYSTWIEGQLAKPTNVVKDKANSSKILHAVAYKDNHSLTIFSVSLG